MTTGIDNVGRVIFPKRGTFIQPLPPYILMKGQQMRYDQSMRYIDEIMGWGKGGRSVFLNCQTLRECEAKIREALVFLTSDTGLHDQRMTSSMPPERVYIELQGGIAGVPGDLYDVAVASIEERRIIYIPDREERRIFCSGREKSDAKVYTSFLETLGLEADKIKDLFCPSVVVVPMVDTARKVVGVAAVAGRGKNFLDPIVDLPPLREFREHAGEMLSRSGLIR